MQYMGHTCTIFIYLTVTLLYVQSMQLCITRCLPQEKKIKKNTQNKNYCTNTAFALLIFVVTHKGSNIVKYYYNLQVFYFI